MILNKYLVEGCATFELTSTTKEDAIRELSHLLHENNVIKSVSRFSKSVFKREKEYTTGVGNGIAIPHGKCRSVQKSAIAFGKSKGGIDWDSLDGNPVHYVFLLAIPNASDGEHLDMLSSLARKLMRDTVIDGIDEAKDYSSLIEAFKDKEEDN